MPTPYRGGLTTLSLKFLRSCSLLAGGHARIWKCIDNVRNRAIGEVIPASSMVYCRDCPQHLPSRDEEHKGVNMFQTTSRSTSAEEAWQDADDSEVSEAACLSQIQMGRRSRATTRSHAELARCRQGVARTIPHELTNVLRRGRCARGHSPSMEAVWLTRRRGGGTFFRRIGQLSAIPKRIDAEM